MSELKFKRSETDKDLEQIFNYDYEAFSDTPDFDWTRDNLKKEVKEGWTLYQVLAEKEIVAVLFTKISGKNLLTKNTLIKLPFQGKGYSHDIKNFYEDLARENKINTIVNYCRRDNFRIVSLNETHGYEKTGKSTGDNNDILEWVKKVS